MLARSAFVSIAVTLALACGDSAGDTGVSEARDSAAISLTDDMGQAVRLNAPAQRILSLIPARTDAILALGAADRLVARTRWDEDPRIVDLPSIDDALLVSVEWIVSLWPDLVIVWPDAQSRTTVARLRELGIATYASRVETLADVRRAVRDLGAMLALESRADSVLAAMDSTFASVRALVADHPVRSVAYIVGIDPPMAAGPGTFPQELIEIAGGSNVFADAHAKWPQISLEALVDRDPDVLIVTVADGRDVARELRGRPGWRELAVVREGRVQTVDPDRFNRAGPALARAALELGRLIHPEARRDR